MDMCYDKKCWFPGHEEPTFYEFTLWEIYYSIIRPDSASRLEISCATISDAILKSAGAKQSTVKKNMADWEAQARDTVLRIETVSGKMIDPRTRNKGLEHALKIAERVPGIKMA